MRRISAQKMLNKLGFVEVSRIGREMYKGSEGQLIQYRFKGGNGRMIQTERVTPRHIISAAAIVLNEKMKSN